jgi:hypothetical protein
LIMFDSLGIMFEKCLMFFPTGKIMPCLIHFDSQSYDPSLIVLSVLSSSARSRFAISHRICSRAYLRSIPPGKLCGLWL